MSGQYALRLWGREITPAYDKASWLWALFIAAYFFLLGFSRLFTVVAFILLLLGVYRAYAVLKMSGWRRLPAAYRNYGLLFLLLWLPLLLSLPDAKYAAEAASDTFKLLLYFFSGLACVWLAQEKRILPPLLVILVGLVAFWAVDVIIQRAIGFDIFGVPLASDVEARASAYFKNGVKFGSYLACMSMLALYYIGPRLKHPGGFMALWLLFLVGLVFTMTRTAWWIFMLFSIPLLFVYVIKPVRHAWLGLLVALLLCFAGLYFYYQHDAVFQSRMGRTLAFMEGMTYDNWNTVLTYRLDLWVASWQMFSESWFNGMGLHAFTNDFNGYPAAPFWASVQPSHEHQYILQVMNATGLIGLAGIIGIHGLLFRLWQQGGGERLYVFPLMIYLAAMWFPVSSHFSFYSSELVWANLMLFGLIAGGLEARYLPGMGVANKGAGA